MKFQLFVVLLAISCLALTSALKVRDVNGLRIFQNKAAPKNWKAVGRADPHFPMQLVVAVKQSNTDVLQKILYEVSNPKHPKFGQYLSRDEVNELTANPAGTKLVQQHLLASGATNITTTLNGDFVFAEMTVDKAEAAFHTLFYRFRHADTGKQTVKTLTYSLPVTVANQVDFVSVNCLFPYARAHGPIFRSLRSNVDDGYVTPDTIFKTYGIDNPAVQSQEATQSVYENLGQSYSPDDLSQFQQSYNVPTNPVTKVIGPNNPNSCSVDPNNCVEAQLDIEYIMAVGQNSPTTFWSIPDSDPNPFLSWVLAVSKDKTPPLVHSISYGDIESQDDPSQDSRFDQELQELGSRGISVIVASGDDGVANFIARSNSSACGFNPSFPATSPHVTAVGATQGPESGNPEIACTSATGGLITSGGGFSVNFAQPAWQSDFVNNYLQNGPNVPPTNLFSSNNRGYPDVALLGYNYITILAGQQSAGSGTSASTPVFAGIITLANGQRLSQGKPALGFLNQILYQLYDSNPAAFNDITSGENNCAAGQQGQQVCCTYGFTATTGWDPISGLGSVNAATFIQALVDL